MFDNQVIDYIIIALYLGGVAAFGILTGGKQSNIKDYFLGSSKVPWPAICFSIVAAETSTLTFISIPGLAYLTNLNFLQVTVGYLIGRIVIAKFFLPAYYKGEMSTAYTFLENRFGAKTRTFASIVFLFTRCAADGVRLFATAIPLKLMLDISYPIAIVIIACVSLIYTYTGGMKGIIWVDVVQMFIYLGGAIVSAIFLLQILPDGLNSVFSAAASADKTSIIYTGFELTFSEFFSKPYTLFGGLIGGAYLSMASHGTDQLIVQRLMAAKDLKKSQKAVIGSGVIIIFQFAIFLFLGLMLYAYYGELQIKSDELFPMFIIQVLPHGLTGLIIAGLFAAAMSTLAGSMSSLSSSTMIDLYLPFTNKEISEEQKLKLSRYFTIMWGGVLILSALFFMNSPQTVVELALSIASFTYGGLLGTFLLGLINKNANQQDAIIGFVCGIAIMILIISLKIVAWTWFTLIGVIITVSIGSLLSKFKKHGN